MSLYIGVIPSKLASFITTGNRLFQLDRRLMNFVSASTHFHECDGVLTRISASKKPTITYLKYKTTIENNNYGLISYSSLSSLPQNSADLSERKIETNESSDDSKPNESPEEQLQNIRKILELNLPRIFIAPMNYKIYHSEIEYINNFKGTTIRGINNYIKQVLYLRVGGHLSYAYIKYDILKITVHPEDKTIKVRWRIRGLSALKVLLNLHKVRVFDMLETIKRLETWYDGLSTYYMGPEGNIVRHVVDKMMPDDETVAIKAKPNIAAKLAA